MRQWTCAPVRNGMETGHQFLNTGTVFERAKNLRDLFPVKFDDGTSKHLFSCLMTQAKISIRSPIKSPSTTATIMAEPAVLM